MKYYPPRFLFRRFELVRRIAPGGTFLEVGPGSFNLTKDLLKLFNDGVVVDFNEEVRRTFDLLSRAERSDLSLVISDFNSFESTETFSAIIACEVLEHIEDEAEFLRHAYYLLGKRGQLVLSVPARRKFWSVHDEGVGHLRRYEKKELREFLKEQGFINVNIISYGFPFVNILRLPRIILAKKQHIRNSRLTTIQQTKESGLSQYRVMAGAFGLICNKYTIAPLSLLASFFNKCDFSNGYIVIAEK
ncbi:MAG: class I SAM-dependent methyltransferase [Candidatus Sabulitectum sp.]|nr:class I SAM-dependent methyltransferase [Candidatus Sabulitectum sp.]